MLKKLCFFGFFLLIFVSSSVAVIVPRDTNLISKYIIGRGDVLQIQAYDSRNTQILSVQPISPGAGVPKAGKNTVSVSWDGRIYMPLLGTIYVDGLTVRDLEERIKREIRKLGVSRNPHVSIFVVSPKPVGVNVFGQVGKPGLIYLPDGDPRKRTILAYLEAAGGLTGHGDKSNIEVIRPTEDGKRKSIMVNLNKILIDKNLDQNIVLKEGDTVFVGAKINSVFVMGEVNNPGPQAFTYGFTVADYILGAGGFGRNSDKDHIKVVRGGPENPVITNIQLGKLYEEGKRDEVVIEPGDIIMVEGDWVMKWADARYMLRIVRDIVSFPRDVRDVYLDLTGQPRPVYFPTE